MARRRKPTTRRTRGGLNENAADNFADLPYVNEIIELGGISIGVVPPLTECVAVAHEGKHTLAMLVRRKGETSIYSKGNQSVQYNLNADAVYPRPRWSASVSYNSSFSSNTGASAVTRNESQLTAQGSCAGTIGTTRASWTSCRVLSRGSNSSPLLAGASVAT